MFMLQFPKRVVKQKIKLMISDMYFLHLMPDVINWLFSASKPTYLTYISDDVIYNFKLSADDVGAQQDSKSQRTSHMSRDMTKLTK